MAHNAKKTEHSGSKKGVGAYYGRKKDAKRESNKVRRAQGKREEVSLDSDSTPGPDDSQFDEREP